jgi:hypothetical protein
VNALPLDAVPCGFVTLIGPDVAPPGTTVVILPSVTSANDATAVLLNLTVVTPKKPEPKIETLVPAVPLCGLNPVILGTVGVTTVKLVALVSVPEGVVTEILPDRAPFGTNAVICVSELSENDASVPLNFTWFTPVK